MIVMFCFCFYKNKFRVIWTLGILLKLISRISSIPIGIWTEGEQQTEAGGGGKEQGQGVNKAEALGWQETVVRLQSLQRDWQLWGSAQGLGCQPSWWSQIGQLSCRMFAWVPGCLHGYRDADSAGGVIFTAAPGSSYCTHFLFFKLLLIREAGGPFQWLWRWYIVCDSCKVLLLCFQVYLKRDKECSQEHDLAKTASRVQVEQDSIDIQPRCFASFV